MADGEKLIPINIEEQMKSAYIDYSMSVIVSRALPDVRDGLKPVHNKIKGPGAVMSTDPCYC